ncbi:MAG: sigma-70 family RNA polymerase sigma factor [Opitutaceae bacterium]|nr:sigma-70 family RNA polymerase sigma factor [Opitutaceae bacterium]
MNELVVKNLKTSVAFARKRVGDPHLAEDLVQEGLVKALGVEQKPANDEERVAWFYRILRRTIIDLYRRRAVAGAQPVRARPGGITEPERHTCAVCVFQAIASRRAGYISRTR